MEADKTTTTCKNKIVHFSPVVKKEIYSVTNHVHQRVLTLILVEGLKFFLFQCNNVQQGTISNKFEHVCIGFKDVYDVYVLK